MPRQFACKFILPVIAASAAFASPAWGQGEDDDPYARCAAMTDEVQRLGCFDTTYAEWQAVQAERARLAAEAARRAEERRAREFGLSEAQRLERREAEAAADPAAAAELARLEDEKERERGFAVTATVVEAYEGAAGKRVVRLDNGQVWRETFGSTMRLIIRPGWQATVTPRWTGTYEMRFEGRRGVVRVSRVE